MCGRFQSIWRWKILDDFHRCGKVVCVESTFTRFSMIRQLCWLERIHVTHRWWNAMSLTSIFAFLLL